MDENGLNSLEKDTFWPLASVARDGHIHVLHYFQHALDRVMVDAAEGDRGMKIVDCKHMPGYS